MKYEYAYVCKINARGSPGSDPRKPNTLGQKTIVDGKYDRICQKNGICVLESMLKENYDSFLSADLKKIVYF